MTEDDKKLVKGVIVGMALGACAWGLITMIALHSCSAKADDWNDADRVLYASTVAGDVLDWSQTRRGAAMKYTEYNPFINIKDAGQVNRYFLVTPVVQYLVADLLPQDLRTWFLGAALAAEVGSVAHNRRVGLSIKVGL
jgi:hypothetical protein